MIITQKFNSVDEIDKEFIPSLEELLSECIPSFDIIKTHESNATENTNFAYYLFFGQATNAPIGFAQLEITKDKPKKKNFIKKIFTRKNSIPKEDKEKSVKWFIPGSLKEGLVFDPKYTKHAGKKALQIFNDFLDREDIHSQEIRFSGAYQDVQSIFNSDQMKNQDDIIIDTLIKNRGSYQEFIEYLSDSTKREIKHTWKVVGNELAYKLGEYTNLKEVFEYKENGHKQYKELKNHPKIKEYTTGDNEIYYLTLESSFEVKCLVIFMRGKGIHGFYDIIALDESYPLIIPHQQAIIKFFELDLCDRLHFLGTDVDQDFFLKLGYTYRKQHVILAQKET